MSLKPSRVGKFFAPVTRKKMIVKNKRKKSFFSFILGNERGERERERERERESGRARVKGGKHLDKHYRQVEGEGGGGGRKKRGQR